MRNYKRTTDRGHASLDQMKLATDAVLTRGLSIRKAAKDFDINYRTLTRYVKVKRSTGDITRFGYNNNRKVFSDELEVLLVEYIKFGAKIYHAIAEVTIRKQSCVRQLNPPQKPKAGINLNTKFLKSVRQFQIDSTNTESQSEEQKKPAAKKKNRQMMMTLS